MGNSIQGGCARLIGFDRPFTRATVTLRFRQSIGDLLNPEQRGNV